MYQRLCTAFLKQFVAENISPKLNSFLEVFEITKSIQNQSHVLRRVVTTKYIAVMMIMIIIIILLIITILSPKREIYNF